MMLSAFTTTLLLSVLATVNCAGGPPHWEQQQRDIDQAEDGHIEVSRSSPDDCLQPAERGNCRAAIPAWFYNAESSECEEFLYGGCQGMLNMFPTRELCYRTCRQDICTLPSETGRCRARIIQWFYDHTDHTCKQFTYGGCGGNPNRFSSESQCQRACAGSGGERLCLLGSNFVTVSKRAMTRDWVESDWFTYDCARRCRSACLQDHSWGVCYAFSTMERWYGCDCFLFDRPLDQSEVESEETGLTRNRACATNPELNELV